MRHEGIPGGISPGAALTAAVLQDPVRNYPLSILKKEA
jgi:hypothetical protein